MKEDINVRNIAIQYFNGNISAADEAQLYVFVNGSEKNLLQFRLWEKEWKQTNTGNELVQDEWKQLRRRMRIQAAVVPLVSSPRLFSWRVIAAIVVLIILTMGGTWKISESYFLRNQDRMAVFEAPYGEKSKVTLVDGTVVWLNSGSILKYSAQYGKRGRLVELVGEGYFDVAKKENQTFMVKTRGYDIVVKGTKFDVSAYPEDAYVTTTLIEGSVCVQYKNREIGMRPGESVKLDVSSGEITRLQVDAVKSRAWSENRVEFDDITLKELAARLSRQYDVNIRVKSEKIGNLRFSVSLRNRETIDEVMEALQKIIPIKVERRGKEIYIET